MTLPKSPPTLRLCQKCGAENDRLGQGQRICRACLEADPWFVPSVVEPIDEPVPVKEPPRVDGTFRPSKWDAVIDRLAQHPSQWFIIAQHASRATPEYLRELAARRGVNIELVTRVGGPVRNRTLRIYARSVAS